MKINLLNILALAGCLAIGGAITSCGSDETNNDDTNQEDNENQNNNENENTEGEGSGETNEYKFEAEYTDVSKLAGSGLSGAAAGTDMIIDAPKASNGYAVAYLHRSNITITYEITADKAGTATMVMSLGNELPSMEYNKDNFFIKVNDVALNYKKFTLRADDVAKPGTEFYDYKVNSTINLKEGLNKITFTVGENNYYNNSTAGPIFDCIKLNSAVKLDWTPLVDNI